MTLYFPDPFANHRVPAKLKYLVCEISYYSEM